MDRWEQLSRLGMKVTGVMQTVTGVSAALAPAMFTRLFHGRDVTSDPLTLRLHLMVWLFVAALGLSYAHAGWSKAQVSRSTLLAAGLGKGVAVLLWIEMMTQGLGTALMPGAIAFDAVLSVLFLITLWRSPRVA